MFEIVFCLITYPILPHDFHVSLVYSLFEHGLGARLLLSIITAFSRLTSEINLKEERANMIPPMVSISMALYRYYQFIRTAGKVKFKLILNNNETEVSLYPEEVKS